LPTLSVGRQKEHLACRRLSNVVICLQQGTNDSHVVQRIPLPPHHLLLHENPEWFTFLVPVYRGCPATEAVKRVLCFEA